jgi:hypothetical protein
MINFETEQDKSTIAVMKQTGSLDALRAEIEQKRETIARLEQERTDLELELAAFEVMYNAEVKPLQDELDAVNRSIEEYEARNQLVRLHGNRLGPVQLEAEVERRLGRSAQSFPQAASPAYARGKWENVSQAEPDVVTQSELKSLYRELAKRFHPDLATEGPDREAHTARMAEINEAYARGDVAALRRAAAESGAQSKLPRTLAELLAERDRLDGLIVKLRQDIAELNRDPLMLLKLDAALARHAGRDLLAETAIEVHIKLIERRGTLNRLIAEFRELVEQVGLV